MCLKALLTLQAFFSILFYLFITKFCLLYTLQYLRLLCAWISFACVWWIHWIIVFSADMHFNTCLLLLLFPSLINAGTYICLLFYAKQARKKKINKSIPLMFWYSCIGIQSSVDNIVICCASEYEIKLCIDTYLHIMKRLKRGRFIYLFFLKRELIMIRLKVDFN